jgi:membrane-bound metal-dependent hydrolase YbcI (DUF457 family)
MWPWGHLALGYLLYSVSERLVTGRRPTSGATVALAVGTQFPDLVDKPLAWVLGVLPSGRSLAHSLFTMVLVVSAVMIIAEWRARRREGAAFGLGYLSHLVGDAATVVTRGAYRELAFLFYPVLPAYTYPDENVAAALAKLLAIGFPPEPTPAIVTSFGLVGLVVVLWLVDGAPVLRYFVALVVGWPRDRTPKT